MQFIDEAAIAVAAGNGGDGIVAWRREKYVPKGGPAGGDGGHGGSVYLEATRNSRRWLSFATSASSRPNPARPGGTSNKSGKSGDDLTIAVPVGTLVYRTLEGKTEALFADLDVARRTPARRQRRSRRSRQPAFRDQRPPSAALCRKRRAGRALRAAARIAAAGRLRHRRRSQRRQIDAALGRFGGASEDRRLSVYHARTAARRRARLRRRVVRDGRRSRADRRRARRRRSRRPLPQARRTHARAGASCSTARSRSTKCLPTKRRSNANSARGIRNCSTSRRCSSSTNSICRTRANGSTNCAQRFPGISRHQRGDARRRARTHFRRRAHHRAGAGARSRRAGAGDHRTAAADAFVLVRGSDGAFDCRASASNG